MKDREVLLVVYGALKAIEDKNQNLKELISEVQDHLFPEPKDAGPAENNEKRGENGRVL